MNLASLTASPLALSWHWITRLGEAQILLPMALAACLWLWWRADEPGLARRWLFWLGAAIALTTLSKIAFIGWGLGVAALDFTGFSGHSMFAAAVLPVLAWIMVRGRGPALQRAIVAMALALAALIAFSRLQVNAHSPSESLLGFMLGSIVSLISLRQAPALRLRPPLWLPAGVTAALLLLPLGAPPSLSHGLVIQLALRLSGHSHPFHRHDLHRPPAGLPQPAKAPEYSSPAQAYCKLRPEAHSISKLRSNSSVMTKPLLSS